MTVYSVAWHGGAPHATHLNNSDSITIDAAVATPNTLDFDTNDSKQLIGI